MKFIPKNFEKLDKKNIVAPVISKPVSKVSSRFSISSLFSRSSNVEPELGSDDKQRGTYGITQCLKMDKIQKNRFKAHNKYLELAPHNKAITII